MKIRPIEKLIAAGFAGALLISGFSAAGTVPAKSTGTQPAAPRLVLLPTRSPIVAFRLELRTGSIDDPAGQEGLAALTAAAIGEGGSKSLAYTEILDKLYPMAASIDSHADKEVTVFSGQVHRDHLEKFYSIFKEILTAPRFDQADFERVQSDAENALTTGLRGSNDEGLGKWTLQLALFRNHPYGHVDTGTVAGIRAIKLEQVKSFYKSHYSRDRLVIGLAGGYPKRFPERVQKDLMVLPEKSAPAVAIGSPSVRKGHHATIVEKDARATAVSWGFPIPVTRRDDDFFALMIANSYLGEHRTFNGVLMNQLRGVRGLNYGDYSYIENFIQSGGSTFPIPNIPRTKQYFSVWIRPVKPDNAPFALRASLYHLDKMIREGIPEQGFKETRDFLLGYSRLWAQSTSRRLGYKLDSEWYGRKDFLDEIQKRLPSITKAQVDTAIRKYLSMADIEIALVSSGGAKLKETLAGDAPTPIHYDTEGTPANILAEDKVIEAFPLGLKADDIAIVPVAEMFEK